MACHDHWPEYCETRAVVALFDLSLATCVCVHVHACECVSDTPSTKPIKLLQHHRIPSYYDQCVHLCACVREISPTDSVTVETFHYYIYKPSTLKLVAVRDCKLSGGAVT